MSIGQDDHLLAGKTLRSQNNTLSRLTIHFRRLSLRRHCPIAAMRHDYKLYHEQAVELGTRVACLEYVEKR